MAAGDKVQNNPNYFNPSVQDSPAPNFLGYSKGIEAPKAQRVSEGGSDAWAQIGNVWRQTVEGTIDATVQSEFKDKLRKGAEDVRDVATNVTLPAELEKGLSEMERMKRSRNAGTMSDTHYYATLDYLVRKQKQRFPGYGEQIDNAITEITGVLPANALRRELVSAQEAGLSDGEKDWREYKQQNAGYIFRSYGEDFFKAEGEGRSVDRNQVYASVARLKADEQSNEVNRNRIALDLAANKQVQDNADVSANQEFWGGFNTMLKVGTAPLGKSYDELQKNLEAAKAVSGPGGADVTAEEQIQLRALFNNFRTTGTNLMQQTLTGYVPQFKGSYNQFMSDGGKQGMQKSFDDFMGNFEKELFDKQTGTLTFMAAMDEAVHASNIAKIRMQNKYVSTAAAVRDQRLLGPLGEAIYTQNDQNLSGITNEVMKLHSKEIIAGTGGALKDTPTVVGADDVIPKSEVGQATTGVMRKTIDVITNGDPADQSVVNAVESFFGPGNQGFLATISPQDSKLPAYNKNQARERIFLEMTAPSFVKKINDTAQRTGNQELITNVRRWTEDTAGALFKVEAVNLQSIVTDFSQSGQLVFDSVSNQFKVAEFARPGQTNRGPGLTSQFQQSLDRVNMSLKALENVYVNTGMDKKEVSAALANFFNDPSAYGINPSAAPTAANSVFSAAYDYLSTIGSGSGKTTYAPADGRRSRMNAGLSELKGDLDGLVAKMGEEGVTKDLLDQYVQKQMQLDEATLGGDMGNIPGRRTPMQRQGPPPKESPAGDMDIYMNGNRMNAGLRGVPSNDNSSWDAVQGVIDRTNENFSKLDATGDKLKSEQARVARETGAGPRAVEGTTNIADAAKKYNAPGNATTARALGTMSEKGAQQITKDFGVKTYGVPMDDEGRRIASQLRGGAIRYNQSPTKENLDRLNRWVERTQMYFDTINDRQQQIAKYENLLKDLKNQKPNSERAIGAGMLGGGKKNPLDPEDDLAR